MATSNMQQSQAMQLLAPDIAQEQSQLQRRQQLADLLRKQAFEPSGNTEVINGWAVKKSPYEPLAKMAQALAAGYVQDKTDSRQLELAKSLQDRLGSVASGGGAGLSSDAAATAALSTNASGPTNANAATQTQLMAPVSNPSSEKYGNKNLIRSLAINAIGGDQASSAFWEDQKSTEAGKRGRELGYTLGEDRKNEDLKRLKENYMPPTRLGEGAYNDPVLGVQGLPTAAPPGFINVKGADGQWTTNAVKQGAQAVSQSEEAKTIGTANATPSVAFDASGKSIFSTKGNDVRRAKGTSGDPPASSGLPTDNNIYAAANDIARSKAELKYVTDPASRKLLEDNIAELESQQKKNGLPTQTSPVSQISPQQNPGVIANADAAQAASAKTMHDSYSSLQTANSTAQSAIEAIDKMQGLAAKKSMYLAGPLATKTTALNPDGAEYEKSRANLTALLDKQLGASGTDAARKNNSDSVPDFGKPKSAIADGLGTIKNQIVAQIQMKTNFLTSHYQAGDSKKYTDMQNQFDQNISPSMVPILSARAGPDRAAMLQKAAKDPAMRARLEWAAQNGLLK